jgi:predicted metal-dependent enzyme (double-stranded beta helix superfamily)
MCRGGWRAPADVVREYDREESDMTIEGYTLQDFVADLERITSQEEKPQAIAAKIGPLLGRLIRNPDCVPPEFQRAQGQRGRYMLHRAPRFNVTAVVWRPGDAAEAHNHETWGVIGVVDNEIQETRYRVAELGPVGSQARLEVKEVLRQPRGAVSVLTPGDEVHAMHNVTDRDTVEIHVYGRDLVGLQRRTVGKDGIVKSLVSSRYLNC